MVSVFYISTVHLVILIYCVQNCVCKTKYENSFESNINTENAMLLSRKKRALTFPPGSTIQLAYDQTMPIAAAQLLFTIGVTVALAFELPDKPIHRITQEIRDNLQKRLHPSSTVAPATNGTNGHSRIDYDNNDLMYIYNNKDAYYNMMNKHKFYYGNSTSIPADDLVSKKIVKTYVNKEGQKVITMKIKQGGKKKKKLGNVFLRKHNRVYPVFGKRSIDSKVTQMNLLFMNHHRISRFDLYEKIGNFLIGHGKNGTACVLRALCETAQKNQSDEKAPFLIEILRAIFTIPHQVMPYERDSHQVYDDAHSNLNDECEKLYPQCRDSIWSPDFSF